MEILSLEHLDPAEWRRFERDFSYPLGGRRFRYESDPQRFFGALGQPVGWFARANGTILGSITGTILDGVPGPVAWLGMIRARPSFAAKLAFVRICQAAQRDLRERGVVAAGGGVMGSTSRLPDQYTGRLGIVPFFPAQSHALVSLRGTGEPAGEKIGEAFSAPHCSSTGVRALRSGGGFATLEDTRRGKRLYWLDNDEEFSPIFLTRIREPHGESWEPILTAARGAARNRSLYFNFPMNQIAALRSRFPDAQIHPWQLYSTGNRFDAIPSPAAL